MQKKAILVLEDGTSFSGYSFGAEGESFGEAVFNTSMTGYQEILTDPSYKKQLVTLTYPMIGNYGINLDESESNKIQAAGLIVKEYSKTFSATDDKAISLAKFLTDHKTVAIEGIDTRKLTVILRDSGAMRAGISTMDFDTESMIKKIKTTPKMEGLNLSQEVACTEPYSVGDEKNSEYKIVALDFGIKKNIIRQFNNLNCFVKIFPGTTNPQTILAEKADGIFVSNGPGDPATSETAIANLKTIIAEKVPMFGICYGHQIISRALGAKTFKLKFGHRGGNHPVMNLSNRKIEISAQNHGFCVETEELPDTVEITHINLNDQTIEGIKHKTQPLFSIQYHPENAPGPHDSEYLFKEFIEMIKAN